MASHSELEKSTVSQSESESESAKSMNKTDGNEGKDERKKKSNLSRFAYAARSSSGGVLVAKEQYSGNNNMVIFSKKSLKGVVESSERMEEKISFLSLLKHKTEVGTMTVRKAERACKANRSIIEMGDDWGCLPSLFFPKQEENDAVCKLTLLIKKMNEVNGEKYFVGASYVTLNVMEYRELITYVTAVLNEQKGGGEGSKSSDFLEARRVNEEDEDDCLLLKKKPKFVIPSSSDDDEPSNKKKAKYVKKKKERKRSSKKGHVVYSSEDSD